MRATRYNLLKKRLTAWRRELQADRSKYSLVLIRATIAAIKADMVANLKERSP